MSIKFTYNNITYTLEFDRKTCEVAERTFGISLTDITSGKVTMVPLLFQAAFMKHHPKMRPSKINEIYASMEDKQGLYEALASMYAECVNTLLDEPDEGNATSLTTE